MSRPAVVWWLGARLVRSRMPRRRWDLPFVCFDSVYQYRSYGEVDRPSASHVQPTATSAAVMFRIE
ncbi:hypothetical protein EF847_06580 [Actinobacteria bacterium YIM 96077]|uniref:Uncharacterized protein n=1 Tax=Phytoactinopolyspora halophila TaxID=1981511 RepID=A0A329QI37_9ACTN|nr:hypothetical protein EF847_06580 [Actinobacteria bacterium YIM 96077]RAW12000.1 hypothetical protein DPM12_15090 [Phytoactinopolyspora halophila]